MKASACAVAAVAAASLATAAIPDEDWGYVDIRTGAHSFWWLYGSTAPTPREQTPLIMWLQGGPGASGVGFGNFQEIGPTALLSNGSTAPRSTTWLQKANLLFVDNPVGTGFSYVDDAKYLTTNNTQIAADLVALLTAFVGKYPEFQTAPFFVFCESYGGKMTAGLAPALLAAIDAGTLKMNFRGVALGDSWINGIDYVTNWGPYLRSTSLMDSLDAASLQPSVDACSKAVAAGQWAAAQKAWGQVEGVIDGLTDGVNFYNILAYGQPEAAAARKSRKEGDLAFIASYRLDAAAASVLHPDADPAGVAASFARRVAIPYGQRLGDPLSDLMNGPIRAHLNSGPGGKIIPDSLTWAMSSGAVFSALAGDFMTPVFDVVDALLAGGRINVTVYNGQLDLICCTPGTEEWMTRMTWPGMTNFYASTKVPQELPGGGGIPGAFKKSFGPLSMWYILGAGHMVPADQGAMALAMVQDILASQS